MCQVFYGEGKQVWRGYIPPNLLLAYILVTYCWARLFAVALAHDMAIQALKHLERERRTFVFLLCRYQCAIGVLASQPVHDRFDIGPPLISIGIHPHVLQ